MKRSLAFIGICLLLLCSAHADEIFSGSSNFGIAGITPGGTSTGTGFCGAMTPGCSTGFSYSVTTAPGYFASDVTSSGTYYSGSFGAGGSINVSFSDGSTLSGYLTWALVSGFSASDSLANDQQLYGAFVATVLTGPMWNGIDVNNVFGTFALGRHFPHSIDFLGPVTLTITSQTPEPTAIAYLVTSAGVFGIRLRKRKSAF